MTHECRMRDESFADSEKIFVRVRARPRRQRHRSVTRSVIAYSMKTHGHSHTLTQNDAFCAPKKKGQNRRVKDYHAVKHRHGSWSRSTASRKRALAKASVSPPATRACGVSFPHILCDSLWARLRRRAIPRARPRAPFRCTACLRGRSPRCIHPARWQVKAAIAIERDEVCAGSQSVSCVGACYTALTWAQTELVANTTFEPSYSSVSCASIAAAARARSDQLRWPALLNGAETLRERVRSKVSMATRMAILLQGGVGTLASHRQCACASSARGVESFSEKIPNEDFLTHLCCSHY